MIRVLGKSKDGNLISDNLEYVFTQDFAIAYKLFDLIPLSVILPGIFYLIRLNDFKNFKFKKTWIKRYRLRKIFRNYN